MSLTVLVTGDGAEAAFSVMNALTDKPLALYAGDAKELYAGAKALAPEQRHVVHGSDSPEFIGDLLALCERCQVDVLVPTGEAQSARIARVRDLFEQLGTRVLLAPGATLDTPAAQQQLARMCCRSQSWLRSRAARLASWAGIAVAA